MPNTTKYALKKPKLPLKRPKTYKKSLSTLSDPPATLIHTLTFYNNIIKMNKKNYPHQQTPPPLAYPHRPTPPPYPQNEDKKTCVF